MGYKILDLWEWVYDMKLCNCDYNNLFGGCTIKFCDMCDILWVFNTFKRLREDFINAFVIVFLEYCQCI